MSSLKDTLRNAAYSVVITVGVFALAELTLAGSAPPPPVELASIAQDEGAMEPSALLGWTPVGGQTRSFGVPETTHINEAGTRNPPFEAKAAGTKRLVTLGDSTVFGVLVRDEEVFSSVAARLLTERLGSPVEPINGGVPGYSSEQARRLYESVLTEVQPDWVVIATLWSDTQDSDVPDRLAYADRTDPLRSLLTRSATFRFLEARLSDRDNATEVKWTISPGQGRYRVMPAGYRENLHFLADKARRDGASPVFLQLPSDRDLRGVELETPRPTYRQIMAEVAEAEGALLVDGYSAFRGGDPGLLLDDVHPSAEGHALLGRVLVNAMTP